MELPVELQCAIFSYLDSKSQFQTYATCKTFRNIMITHSRCWHFKSFSVLTSLPLNLKYLEGLQGLDLRDCSSIVLRFKELTEALPQLKCLIVKEIGPSNLQSLILSGSLWKNLESLSIEDSTTPVSCEQWERFRRQLPNLHTLKIHLLLTCNCAPNPCAFEPNAFSFNALKILYIKNTLPEQWPFEFIKKLPASLQALQLELPDESLLEHLTAALPQLNALSSNTLRSTLSPCFPKTLKELSLAQLEVHDTEALDRLAQCPDLEALKTLSLQLRVTEQSFDHFITLGDTLRQLKTLAINGNPKATLLFLSRLPQLKTLEFILHVEPESSLEELFITQISLQTCMKIFSHLEALSLECAQFHPQTLLPSTLKTLTLRTQRPIALDTKWAQTLPQLQTLTLTQTQLPYIDTLIIFAQNLPKSLQVCTLHIENIDDPHCARAWMATKYYVETQCPFAFYVSIKGPVLSQINSEITLQMEVTWISKRAKRDLSPLGSPTGILSFPVIPPSAPLGPTSPL